MTRRLLFLIGVIAMTFAAAPAAAQPAGLSPLDLDRLILDTLKDVHNKGADLYNTGDPPACYRMYQGALVAVRPFLGHHPAIQKAIDDGLADVAKSEGVKIQAFRLHEVIEQVRSELKTEIKKLDTSKPKDPPTAVIGPPSIVQPKPPTEVPTKPKDPPTTTPTPKPVTPPEKPKDPTPVPPKPVTPPEKPKDPTPVPPKPVTPPEKPKDPTLVPPKPVTPPEKPKDPVPVPPKPVAPPAVTGGMITGKVQIDGKPGVGSEVTFVSLDQAVPRVFTAAVMGDGLYAVTTAIPPGKYAVMASGTRVPEKYQSVATSGVTVQIVNGPNNLDLALTK